jgi:hypothetical protein
MNGLVAVNGTIWADGQGKMTKNMIVNYNGQIYRINNATSTYQVNPDGTYRETFVTQLGVGFATIIYDGVLVKNGKEARLIVSGFLVHPEPVTWPLVRPMSGVTFRA